MVFMKRSGDNKLSKVVSTKVSIEEYKLCQEIARDCYIKKNIRTPSISELTRLALKEIIRRYRSNIAANKPVNQEKIQKTQERALKRPQYIKYRGIFDMKNSNIER